MPSLGIVTKVARQKGSVLPRPPGTVERFVLRVSAKSSQSKGAAHLDKTASIRYT
jgi:hypothetical protein